MENFDSTTEPMSCHAWMRTCLHATLWCYEFCIRLFFLWLNVILRCSILGCWFCWSKCGINKQVFYLFIKKTTESSELNGNMPIARTYRNLRTVFFLNFREYSIEKYFDRLVITDSVHGRLYWIAKLIQFVLDWIKLSLQYISYLLIIFVLQVSKGWWHYSALIFYNFAFFCASHWHFHLLDISK